MDMTFRYKGPFILESDIPGESKRDFAIPNYATGMRVSPDRWLVVYDTVDCRGCDFWRSVLYQVRAGAPDGRIVKSGVIAALETHHRPFGERHPVWKGFGNADVFGAPLPAPGEAPSPAAGIVVITWNSRTELWNEGMLVQRDARCRWPAEVTDAAWLDVVAELGSPCLMRQYRFDPATDDLAPLDGPEPSPAVQPRRLGHDLQGICNWGSPVRLDRDGLAWVAPAVDPREDSLLVFQRYAFDAAAGRFRLDGTTAEYRAPADYRVGEPSLIRIGEHDWMLAVRCFRNGGKTLLYRFADPFAGIGEPRELDTTYGQRMLYQFADGSVRLTLNHRDESPYKDRRNPLYCWRIDPVTLQPTGKEIVFDSRVAGIPLAVPFVDHTHLFESGPDGRQLMTFRMITERHVWAASDSPPLTPEEMRAGGIYACEVGPAK